jgi:hypothetical protein
MFGFILLESNTFYDQHLMQLMEGLRTAIRFTDLVDIGRQIGAIGALLYLSIKAFAIMAGEQRFEVITLFRPFIIAMCILNFGIVTRILDMPAAAANNTLTGAVIASSQQVRTDLEEKDRLTQRFWDRLIEITNEGKKQEQQEQTWLSSTVETLTPDVVNDILELSTTIVLYQRLMYAKLSIWLQGFVVTCLIATLKGLFYCIFFLQILILTILTALGPIAFGFSVLGPWRDSWSHWAGKYLSVTFYSVIAMLVMNIALLILDYGILQENARLSQILSQTASGPNAAEQFITEVLHFDNFIGYVLIAVFAVFGGMVSIPIISTWFINTAGTSGAIFNQGARAVQTAATATVGAVAKAGKAAAVAM